MQEQDFTIQTLLQNISSKDNELRKKSEKQLFKLSYLNPFEFIKQITMQLTNEQQDQHIRFLSGLMFTMITTRVQQQTKLTAWQRILPEERKIVQQGILQALATQSHQVRKGASNAVAKVARIALQMGEWDQLFPTLIQGMEHEKKEFKLSCILAVGKICQDARSSSIKKDEAKQLFTVLLKQMQTNDEILHSYGLQSILVMIPLAGGLLENDQEFSMMLSDQIMNFINAENIPLKLQERAWRCMNEICHFFYVTLHNKYEYLITKIFQILRSDPEKEEFEVLSVISVETMTSIIIQEFERSRRKLFNHNMIMPISQKLASELIQVLKTLSQKSTQIDELTTGAFPGVEASLEKLMQFADKTIIPIVEEQIQVLFDSDDTRCAGITVAACYFNSTDTQATRVFLEKGFAIFIDLLLMDKIFVVERMVRLFEAALQQHYEVLILDPDCRKKLLDCLLNVDSEKDFDIALLKLKLLLKFSTVSNNYNLPTNPTAILIMETCYKIILTGEFKKVQYELPHRACLTFTKAAGTIKQNTQEFQILRDNIFIMMCSDISDKIQKLNQLSDCENKALDFLFEMTGQVLLTLQRIQFKHLNVLIGFIFTVFEHRKNIGSQACSLLTGLITAGEGLEIKQIMISTIPYITYVLSGGAQKKVISDVLLTISSISMVIRNEIFQFFGFLTPLAQILQESTEHGILYLGVQVYSDFAFYAGSLFKPHVERFLEVLEIISRKIINYWEEKQEEGRIEIFQFDQDDKACIKLTEGLVDAYHNCVIGSDQGKWKVKLANYGNTIVGFLEQVLLKMATVLSMELLMEIGYTFVDYLRVLKQTVYQWYKERSDFFQNFVIHLINQGRNLREKTQRGENSPTQCSYEEVIKCGMTISEWFRKYSINIHVPE